jgi:hypothetical protein
MLVYGFLLWLVTFVFSVAIHPLKDTSNTAPLFESLMAVALSLFTLWFLYLYFKGVSGDFAKAGLVAGIVWLVISILLDQLLFTWGPMQMSFVDYMYDIGLTYLMVPVITTCVGYLMDRVAAGKLPLSGR